MKKLFSVSILGLFIVSVFAAPAFCQTADEIVSKMIEAQGGRDKLATINDTTVTGTMELTSMGLSGTFTRYMKEPNKLRMDIEVMGMVITQAFDGETAWATNPQTGSTEEMPEQAAAYFKRDSLGNDSLLNPDKYGITFASKETEKIDDKDYLVLEQTFSDGYKSTIYVDPETYLPYKTKAMTLNQMGMEVEAETLLTDYREFEGVKISYSITVFQDGEEFITIALDEVTFNKGLEDSLFAMEE